MAVSPFILVASTSPHTLGGGGGGGGVNAGLECSMPGLIFKRPKLRNNFIFRIVYFCFPSFLSLIFND